MTAKSVVTDTVRMRLLAVPQMASLAGPILTRYCGIGADRAQELLRIGHGVIADDIAPDRAAAALPLLGALGLRVVLERVGAQAPSDVYDLSVWLRDPTQLPRLTATLQRLMGPSETCQTQVFGPMGQVYAGLSQAQSTWLTLGLRRIAGVQVVTTNQACAVYDLFAADPIGATAQGLDRFLGLMGLARRSFADEIASGLDGAMRDQITRRFDPSQVLAINRDFQRFDLFLDGPGGLSDREYTDFLATRGQFDRHSAHRTVRIEHGLTRAAARQFAADYAAIGLTPRALLLRTQGTAARPAQLATENR